MDHTASYEISQSRTPPSITSLSSTVFRASDALHPFVNCDPRLRSSPRTLAIDPSFDRACWLGGVSRSWLSEDWRIQLARRSNTIHDSPLDDDRIRRDELRFSTSLSTRKHEGVFVENTRTRVRWRQKGARVRMSCERMIATCSETLDRIVTTATTAMPPCRAPKRRSNPAWPPLFTTRHPHSSDTSPAPLASTRLYSLLLAASSLHSLASRETKLTPRYRARYLAEIRFRGWCANYRDGLYFIFYFFYAPCFPPSFFLFFFFFFFWWNLTVSGFWSKLAADDRDRVFEKRIFDFLEVVIFRALEGTFR